MLTILKTKLALTILGLVAATGVAGTTVVAAQQHAGPFAPWGIFAQHTATPSHPDHGTPAASDQTQYHAQGLIQSVSLNADKQSGTLQFLPNGTSASVTILFTAHTHVEVADAADHANTPGQVGAAGLRAGIFAVIVGTKQHDGTVLASEIQANANGNAHQGGNMPTPGPGNGHVPTPGGHPDPTPGPSNGRTPTPGPHH